MQDFVKKAGADVFVSMNRKNCPTTIGMNKKMMASTNPANLKARPGQSRQGNFTGYSRQLAHASTITR